MATNADKIAAKSDLQRKVRQFAEDLRPFPGRLYLSLTIGAICAISIVICMMYHYPEAAIGCYLVIYLMKPNAAENVLTGVGIIIVVTIVVAFMVFLTQLTISSPPAQIAAIVISSFIFLYLDSATKAGEQAGIVALVIAFILTLLGDMPVGEVATRALLYAWAMVSVPMAVMVIYNLLFGIPPQRLLRWTMIERLERAEAFLRAPSHETEHAMREMLNEGTDEQEKQLKLIRMFHILTGEKFDFLERSQSHSYRVLLAVSNLNHDADRDTCLRLAHAFAAMADALRTNRPFPEFDPVTYADTPQFAAVVDSVDKLAAVTPLTMGAPVVDPFVSPDIFTNPKHLQFSLKTTLAAVLCYFIYTAADWQGIHTAMITCYVAALGSTGDTIHKLVLRITGCLIGATIGLLSILFIIPHLESIGGFAFLIFGVISLAAWVSTGNERLSYGGVQVGLAFLLTVVQGFGPGISLSSGWDRVMGILLGNAVIFIIFSNIWPVSVTQQVADSTRRAVQKMKSLTAIGSDERRASTTVVASIQSDLGVIRNAVEMASYEPRHVRPSWTMRTKYRAEAEELNKLALELYFKPDLDDDLKRRVDAASEHFDPPQERTGDKA